METKHTPGPWTIRPVWINKEIVEFSIEHEKGHLASVHCAVDSELEDDANARLIAAAPEMLEALKAAKDCFTGHNLLSTATDEQRLETISRFLDWWNFKAIPAIAKAEGKVL